MIYIVFILFLDYRNIGSMAQSKVFCNNEYCQKDWTPFPNMGGGLTGYDPVFADPLNEFGDPGLRNQIFKPTLEETDPATYRVYVPSYLNVEDNLRCNGKISTEVFRSYSSYNDKRMASMEQSKEKTSSLNIGGTAQGKGNIKGVPVQGQMSMNYARNDKQENNKQSEESKLQAFFSESNGEIYMSEMTCQIYTMKVNEFAKVEFQDGFVNSLRSLHYASSLPDDSPEADAIFGIFIAEYGTSYVEEVSMGAKMVVETRFNKRASGVDETKQRISCIANSMSSDTTFGGNIQGSADKVKGASVSGGVSGSISNGIATKDDSCGDADATDNYLAENSLREVVLRSIGSLPTEDIEQWRPDTPVPIQYKVRGLEYIIKPYWEDWYPNSGGNVGGILYDPNDSNSEKLNGTRIQAFFIKKMYHYCKIVLGWDDCGLYELSGCGINSDCPPNTRCENDESDPSGHKCVPCNCFAHGSNMAHGQSCYYKPEPPTVEWNSTLGRKIHSSYVNLTSLKLNYEEAKSKCSHFDERASLISLRTRLDLTALKEYNNKPHWIGGKFDLTKMEWVWNDGKTINWGIFDKSRPSNTIGVKTGCLDHEMKPMACEAKNYFLCSMEDGWRYWKQSKQMVYDSHNSGQEKLSYDDARNRCKDLNKKADLISIKSGKDYDQLSSLAGILSPNEYWIGGFDQGIWDYKNGKLVKTNREWRWVDGTKMTYTNWAVRQPNNRKKIQNCLQMERNKQWNDEKCSNKYYFICAYYSDGYRPELEIGGQCKCKPYITGKKCDKCVEDAYGIAPNCKACGCNEKGSVETEILVGNDNKTFHTCNQIGQCNCINDNIAGKTCNTCKFGFKPFPACNECLAEGKWGSDCSQICDCNPMGTKENALNSCDKESGQCMCKPNWVGRTCNEIAPGTMGAKNYCKDKRDQEMRDYHFQYHAIQPANGKPYYIGGCETGEGNCNHDDECKQPGRRCGDSSVNVPDLPTETRVCEELPKCDISQWNDDLPCCTVDRPCDINEGHCDSDDQCWGEYTCVSASCPGETCTSIGILHPNCPDCCQDVNG